MSEMPEGAARYLDHGFVKLLDVFGSDQDIEAAARVSYSGGDPNRKVSDTRNLLRYLMRHEHTSPFEMAEVKFILRVPIFVMRQLVRHRTASLNEYSGRYSVMTEDCYVPELDRIQKQSTDNKQGSGELFSENDREDIRAQIFNVQGSAVKHYNDLIKTGFAKELARGVLPVSNYTELYWKCDLNNFFRFLRLRLDAHAQWEIRELATLMYEAAKPAFPISFEAFEDYMIGGQKFSHQEMHYIETLVEWLKTDKILTRAFINSINDDQHLSTRERDELLKKLKLV